MKQRLFFLILFLIVFLPSQAVLKEQNLNKTLHVLRLELYDKYQKQEEIMKQMHDRNEAQHTNLVNIMKRCETTSLILYSQGQDFTFDVAYACQQATTLYHELRSRTLPFDEIKNNIMVELARYDSLVVSLQRLPPAIDTARTEELRDLELAIRHVHAGEVDNLEVPAMEGVPMDGVDMEGVESEEEVLHHHQPFLLDSIGRQDRDSCIAYAVRLRDNVKSILEHVESDSEHYTEVSAQVEKLNNYAQQKYAALQQSIFVNPGSSYFTILSRFPMQWRRMKRDFRTKYAPLSEDHQGIARDYPSEWRGPVVLFASIFMFVYILIAALISNVVLRFCIPKKYLTETYRKKRPVFIILLAVLIFAIAVMVVRQFIQQNLMLMATSLMIQMAWLIAVIYISMAVRLNADQCKEGAKIYNPFILMSLLVICFRIVLIPNALVNIIFPPILLIFTIWQGFTLRKCRRNIPLSDKIYCFISFFAMLVACVMSWVGYTLMAVQVLVWWMFQLAAITTVTCCYDLMEMYEHSHLETRIIRAFGNHLSAEEIATRLRRGDFVSKTWFYDFVNRALVPVCAVFSIFFSILMAADIFNLRDLCFSYFFHRFTVPGILSCSLFQLCLVVALFFVFRYVNYIVCALWFNLKRNKTEDGSFDSTLSKNIIGLITWGVYVIMVFIMLDVPSTGIQIVTGGLATGMGFASKSLLENFFYGISLMSGRVRVGDYIECDGITGKVESITYQSTQLLTLDGSIVAILNSDLFSKNFKNLTRNHQYELTKIPFGVAYGTPVEKVRSLVLEGIRPICGETQDGRQLISPEKPLSVTFSDFGASSVDLFLVAWVLVDQRIAFMGHAKEKIYEVLNENGIEIPFPQQDIYIRSIQNS